MAKIRKERSYATWIRSIEGKKDAEAAPKKRLVKRVKATTRPFDTMPCRGPIPSTSRRSTFMVFNDILSNV